MNDLEWRLTCDLQAIERFLEDCEPSIECQRAMASLERLRSETQRLSRTVLGNSVPHDPLVGRELADGNTPLSLATMDDIGVELGRRQAGQPGVLIYQDRPGVWPVRLGPGVEPSTLWKIAGILLSTAEALPGIAESLPGPSPFLPKRRFWNTNTRALHAAMSRRGFEIRLDRRRRWQEWLTAALMGAALGITVGRILWG